MNHTKNVFYGNLIVIKNIKNFSYATKRQNFVYLITFNDQIIKIGGSKTSIKNRIASYQCGHCIPERKKKNGEFYPGKMSITNAIIYNTIYHYLLQENNKFKLYVYPIKNTMESYYTNVFGEKIQVEIQNYDTFEKYALDCYYKLKKEFPILSKNSHPK
jgi:hypothetical protein